MQKENCAAAAVVLDSMLAASACCLSAQRRAGGDTAKDGFIRRKHGLISCGSAIKLLQSKHYKYALSGENTHVSSV
ncbi:hypothetical protein [Acinetobacter sp.]|uniref:hypothetical protein n=1 Tax=Acinetobacter sp. TaxID=472 RepID=UPI002FC803E4